MPSERVIRVIPPALPLFSQDQPKRVCAYVRVSTHHTAQMDSLQNQTEYYERKIKGTPGYAYCGIYADSGIPGSKEKRPGFQAMMAAARKGEIDLILTKAVSRFARNTVMLLKAVRELKGLGVAVVFEDKKINTLSAQGELFLTILASFAEEERRTVCKNVQWSIRSGYRQGKPGLSLQRLLGYRKGKGGKVEIDEEEAEIVRMIYRRYLAGCTTGRIAREFNEGNVHREIDKPWSSQCIRRLLSNERYIGDCLLQKTFVLDSGLQVRNKGQMAQYYIEDHHPAIISREDWESVQKLLEQDSKKSYPFSSMLRCPYCGATLIRVIAEKKWVSWKCGTYLHHGKAACIGVSVPDHIVQAFHEKNPITEPMAVKEVNRGKRIRYKLPEHYDFSPLSLSGWPGR